MNIDLVDWIALNLVRGIGPRTANILIRHFVTPANVFAAHPSQLIAQGLKPESVAELQNSQIFQDAEAEIQRAEALGAAVICLRDARYPPLLREIFDPPIVLYVMGDLATAVARPSIAIVGSRRCSTYGANAAAFLARELALRGITVVSGLARGIDAAAHKGCLEASGRTIAVVGTGLDINYPRENSALADQIRVNGAIVSEFPLGTPPLAQNFPYRNRVISGLGLGVLIVEAAEHSGSLITARMAAEQGREVFAVPGNITSRNSFGPNFLIKDGAKLVQQALDVIEEFPPSLRASFQAVSAEAPSASQPGFDAMTLSREEARVLSLLTPDEGIHVDQILAASGLELPTLMTALLDLEMKDRIKELPGKCFAKRL